MRPLRGQSGPALMAAAGRPATGEALRCVALPLGGIGTGNVALCGDGTLRQWQLHNRPNHLALLPESFFALRVSGIEPPSNVQRLLQSRPVPAAAEPAANVSDHVVPFDADPPAAHWSPVEATSFEGAYPFARLRYLDDALPLEVGLEAYTPFVPLDEEASGLPLASFAFTLSNPTAEQRHGWLLATLQNAAGWDGATPIHGERCSLYGGNVNRLVRRGGSTAIVMDNPALADDHPDAGELALSTEAPCAALPRFARAADALRFVEALKLFQPTAEHDWPLEALRRACAELPPLLRVPAGPSPPGQSWSGALAAAFVLAPGEARTIEFVLAWRFPNRRADFDQFGEHARPEAHTVRLGNHYCERFGTALDAIDAYRDEREGLRARSEEWVATLTESTLPAAVVETLLLQPALIRSPTTFRSADGRFYGFEGSLGESTLNWNGSLGGSCALNCTHVWNYEQAVARLFPALERSMRETELLVTQAPDGHLPHRVLLPLALRQLHDELVGGPNRPALDGMLGAPLKCYRELRQGAGVEWIGPLWPRLVALIDYVEATWNTAGDGVLAGEQPVTHDISLRGPNMFVGALWLASLRAMEEMARLLDPAAAARYHAGFAAASARYDELLWNGEYYAEEAPASANEVGSGCLSDQLFGQWWAHQLELGHLLPETHVRSALAAVVRHNLRHGFRDFTHDSRVFADGDDSGLLVCTWPRGGRPAVPLRYCDEVWTGVEYQVAAHCLMEGLEAEGLAVLDAVRARYDGTRRNPYNEVECGDHYARAMAGWSLLEAASGVRYDAIRGTMSLGGSPGRFAFFAGGAWGSVSVEAGGAIEILCRGGRLALRALVVHGAAPETIALDEVVEAGRRLIARAPAPAAHG